MTISEIIESLRDGRHMDVPAVETAAAFLLDEAADTVEKADLLRALSAKGETAGEIAAFVRVFLTRAIRPPLDLSSLPFPSMDVCGTGGDKLDLFNISTAAMFVLAGNGVAVVKHGNRGITSKSGGADVLEALGVAVDLTPEQFALCVKETGAGFMLAPRYLPAFKAVAPVRALLASEGVRTVFNLIGPLLNPLQPLRQLVGVHDPALLGVYAEIMKELGRRAAWAVHGSVPDSTGMDEVSILGPTRVAALRAGEITETDEHPVFPPATLEDLKGGDAATNAAIVEGILAGGVTGAKRNIVIANAAAGFMVAGYAETWPEGIDFAERSLQSGRARGVLDKMRAFSQSPRPVG